MAEYEFVQVMNFIASHMRSINLYNKIFCDSGMSDLDYTKQPEIGDHHFESVSTPVHIRIRNGSFQFKFSATYCFIMNERLFLNNQPVLKQTRDVSNILYYEMRKHDGNRYLVYVFDEENEFEFDEDFTFAEILFLNILLVSRDRGFEQGMNNLL